MCTANIIHLNDLHFDNTRFWAYFLSVNYPNAILEEPDVSMYELVQQVLPLDPEWSDSFTQYYDGVLEECDGYLEHPTTLFAKLGEMGNLKIEFHPGDTIFYQNDEEIGCTGPHWDLCKIPYQKIEELLTLPDGALLFFLLLPMAALNPDETARPKPVLKKLFSELGFSEPVLSQVIDCLIAGITISESQQAKKFTLKKNAGRKKQDSIRRGNFIFSAWNSFCLRYYALFRKENRLICKKQMHAAYFRIQKSRMGFFCYVILFVYYYIFVLFIIIIYLFHHRVLVYYSIPVS